MRFNSIALVAMSALILAGCGDGIYSTSVTHDGTVIVVNKLTGSVQKVEGGSLIELRSAPKPANPNYRPTLADASIPKQPIRIVGVAKYRGGNMLVKLDVRPDKPALSPDEWNVWRKHIQECRQTDASLRLNFIDSDGFLVTLQQVPLNEMTRTVDAAGNLVALREQISIELPEDSYNAITGWGVGRSGWEQCEGISVQELNEAVQDKKREGTSNK